MAHKLLGSQVFCEQGCHTLVQSNTFACRILESEVSDQAELIRVVQPFTSMEMLQVGAIAKMY